MLDLPPIASIDDHERSWRAKRYLVGGIACLISAAVRFAPPYAAAVGLGLLVWGTYAWLNAARCPKCDARWLWQAWSEHFPNVPEHVRAISLCPACGYAPPLRRSRTAAPPLSEALESALQRAVTEHGEVTLPRIALELLRVDGVLALVRALSVSASALKDQLRALERELWQAKPSTEPAQRSVAPDAQQVLNRAAAAVASSGLPEITSEMVLLTVLDPSSDSGRTRELLIEAGLDLYNARVYLAHGAAAELDPPELPGTVDVIFHNDPFTTMELVLELLTGIFAVDAERASELMTEVHEQGSAVIATLDGADAAQKVARLRERTVREQAPLRVSFEAKSSA